MPDEDTTESQHIADAVKKFLQEPAIQGGLVGAGGGTLLGLMRTDPELRKLAPYIVSGGLTGTLGGAAYDAFEGDSRPSQEKDPSLKGRLLVAAALATALGVGGKLGGKTLQFVGKPFAESKTLRTLGQKAIQSDVAQRAARHLPSSIRTNTGPVLSNIGENLSNYGALAGGLVGGKWGWGVTS